MTDDRQDIAEALDEDKTTEDLDYSGDAFGDDLRDFPPDTPLGVGTVGVTPVEEDAGESFAERTWREVPEELPGDDIGDPSASDVGQLVEPDASSLDDEAQQ